MNIRFSLHSTLMSSIFWQRVTKYRHRIDFWQRSTEKYPHFHDLLSDQTGLKFRNIPVLRVRMSALSLSLFSALFLDWSSFKVNMIILKVFWSSKEERIRISTGLLTQAKNSWAAEFTTKA